MNNLDKLKEELRIVLCRATMNSHEVYPDLHKEIVKDLLDKVFEYNKCWNCKYLVCSKSDCTYEQYEEY